MCNLPIKRKKKGETDDQHNLNEIIRTIAKDIRFNASLELLPQKPYSVACLSDSKVRIFFQRKALI